MAFKSQYKESRVSSRRGSSSVVVVTQSYKPSTKSEELSFRISLSALLRVGMTIGDKADVLFDDDKNLWMIVKGDNGFTISGKKDGPTGLIRYTIKDGHYKLTNERSDLPVKKDAVSSTIVYEDSSMIFELEI